MRMRYSPPSHAPRWTSARSSTISGSMPTAAASGAAVSCVRRSGVTKSRANDPGASARRTASACSRPSGASPGSLRPPTSGWLSPSTTGADAPWRTRITCVAPSGSANGRWWYCREPLLSGLRRFRLLWPLEASQLGGEAGARQGARSVALALGVLAGDRRSGRGRSLRAEDVLLRAALEERLELVLLDRLALDEDLRDGLEPVAVLLEDPAGAAVGVLDDAADLVVDLAGDLVGVVGLGGELAAEEGLRVVVAEDARPELLAHPEAHDHLLGGGGDLLEVVRRARRDLVEDDLLRGAAPEGHGHRVGELGASGQELVLLRHRDRVAERLAAGHHGDLVDRVGMLEVVADDRVAHLVVGRDQALLLAHDPGLLLRAGDHAHDPLLELELADLALAAAGGEEGGLVHEVREVGAGEAGGLAGERVGVDGARERLAAGVDVEDLGPPLAVGAVDDDLAVEAAGTEQRRIEDVRAVRGGDEDDVVLHLEAVHLHQELVQRLLALVVPAAHAGPAVAADGVDLVHEDDAGRVLLRLLEEVADAGGADPDEHLDEVGSRDREEGDARLTRNGAGEQRLAGARRPVEQDALRDPRPERLELLGVLEELLDLVELLDRLVHAGDVAERDLRRVDREPLGLRFPEGHHLRAAALHLVHQEDPEPDEDQEREDVREQGEPAVGLRGLDVEGEARRLVLGHLELVDQLVGVELGIAGLVLLAAALGDVQDVRLGLHLHGLKLAALELREELAELGLRGGLCGRDQLLREERQHHHDEDRERGALEEPAHTAYPGRNCKGDQSSGADLARAQRRTASCGTARRGPGRTRWRRCRGSRSRRSGSGGRPCAAPAWSRARRPRATPGSARPGFAAGTGA